jgi:hypothetical protein
MVVGNMCTLSNVHKTGTDSLAVLAMRLHGTSTKYICLSSTLYTSLLVLGGEVPCNLTQIVSNTPGGTLVSGETITTFYEFA